MLDRSAIYFLFFLAITNSLYSMNPEPPLKKGKRVRVVGGPERLHDQIMEIQGSSKEVWGIDDVWGSHKAMGIRALTNYMFEDHGPDDFGIVYYVKNQYRIGYCVHESWIALVETDMETSDENVPVQEDNSSITPEHNNQGFDCMII